MTQSIRLILGPFVADNEMRRDFALAIYLCHPEPVEGPLIFASVSEKIAARKGKVKRFFDSAALRSE